MSEPQVDHDYGSDGDEFASTQAPPPTVPPERAEPLHPRHAGRWVESSWDLRRGLSVREGLPTDAALDEWIDALLRG